MNTLSLSDLESKMQCDKMKENEDDGSIAGILAHLKQLEAERSEEAWRVAHLLSQLEKQLRPTKTYSKQEQQEQAMSAGADNVILRTMEVYLESDQVQVWGCRVLAELMAQSSSHQRQMLLKGGVEAVIHCMMKYRSSLAVQQEGCRTLRHFAKDYHSAKITIGVEGLCAILLAMKCYSNNPGLQYQACYALTSLTCLKALSVELVQQGGVPILLHSIHSQREDPRVLSESFRTLKNVLCQVAEQDLDEQVTLLGGIHLAIWALAKFPRWNRAPLQARSLVLLYHLCLRSPSNCATLSASQEFMMSIKKVLEFWKEDGKIQILAKMLLGYIGNNTGRTMISIMEEASPQNQ